jgi:hypothetical protein
MIADATAPLVAGRSAALATAVGVRSRAVTDATPPLVAGRSAALATAVGVRSRAVANTAPSGAGSRSRTTGRTSRTATGTTTLCPCRRHAEAQCQSESGNCDLLFHVLFLFEICLSTAHVGNGWRCVAFLGALLTSPLNFEGGADAVRGLLAGVATQRATGVR